jgi:hypothetical protein
MKELMTILRESPEPFSRLYEAIHMRIGGHRLTFREYIDYQLHIDQTLAADERRRFIGEDRKWRLHVRCNRKQWFMLHYKIPFTQFMLGSGLPIPKIYAFYDKHSAHYLPGAIALNNEAAAIEYLTNTAPFPIFIKPDDGQLGEGAAGIQEYCKETRELIYTNGNRESVENFAKKINKQSKTLLFQELLRPGKTVANVCGQAISSLRVTIGRTAQGLEIVSACWRIPVGKNMTDNFCHGVSGNLLGGIDTKTGRVTQVYGRSGNKVGLVKSHPDTNYSFEGFMIPDWARIIDMLMTASKTMTGLNLQNWDVALTDQGPVITEINVFGDMDIHQYANRQGFRSPKLEEVLAHSYQIYLNEFPWIIRKITPFLQKLDSLR